MKQHGLSSYCKYVSQNVLGMISLSCYILADTFFISKAFGTNGLAALNLAISVYSLIHAAGLMLGIGGATKYAILRSQGKEKQASSIFTQISAVGLLIGAVFFLVGILFSVPLAKALGADSSTLDMASTYLRTILCFSPCFLFNNILLAFVRNDKAPKRSMAAMLTGSLGNVLLDYIFVFPLSMGMFGAAFATGLAPVMSIGVLSLHFIKRKNNFRLVRCPIRLRQIAQSISLGLSSFITEVSSGLCLLLFNLIILRISGNTGVAAYGIIANTALVATAVFTGVAQGVQPLVSKSYGIGDKKNLKELSRYSFCTCLLLAAAIYLITALFPNQIIAVFNSSGDKALASIAQNGFRLYFPGFLFAGINIVASAFLSAIMKPKAAFLISITRGFLALIPLAFFLSRLWEMNGVWLSFPIAELIALMICVSIYFLNLRNTTVNDAPLRIHRNR